MKLSSLIGKNDESWRTHRALRYVVDLVVILPLERGGETIQFPGTDVAGGLLIASLNQGEGTAGQLLQDKQLYENMNGAVVELRNLVKAITADPRKFLNVRVSLF